MLKRCIVLSSIFLATAVFANSLIIRGKVRHANTYKEISSVNIYIQNSRLGTVSAPDGFFEFSLEQPQHDWIVIFEHVAFDTLRLALGQIAVGQDFYLQPRIIQAQEIQVQASRTGSEIMKDLPQPYSVIHAHQFDLRGFTDAGDLLHGEQSIQAEEELSGKKTLALRGGNADDIIVLYNGVKMKSAYDNVFDVSMINLDDVQQVEIIRGSNTSLFGPEAFSGVINIVPKLFTPYRARLVQKIGTYSSGDWNFQLHHTFKNKVNVAYSYKNGASKRPYLNDEEDNFLQNSQSHHSASILYDLSDPERGVPDRNISLMFVRTGMEYKNTRYSENINNNNQLLALRYSGNIGLINDLNLTGAYQWYNNEQNYALNNAAVERHFLNKNIDLAIEKNFRLNFIEYLLGYQYEQIDLDFKDKRSNINEQPAGIESALFTRQHHGVISLLKFHLLPQSLFLKNADIDLSYRFDAVNNEARQVAFRQSYYDGREVETALAALKRDWTSSTFKFSTLFRGSHKYFQLNSYLNFGSNVKFPSLYQQLSAPQTFGHYADQYKPRLSPERNKSLDIGIELTRVTNDASALNGWQLNFNYFQNFYENKFRLYYQPGIPVAHFDNVQDASIKGLEAKGCLYVWKSKLSFELGSSAYYIAEKSAFPFKSAVKFVFNTYIDHAGYALFIHGFSESEQSGWVRAQQGEFYEVTLPGQKNFDVHLGKTFEIYGFKFITNISVRNLLSDDTKLEGLALRDRRYYFSFGLEY